MKPLEEYRKLAGLVERPALHEASYQKIPIKNLPEVLRKVVRQYSKAREAWIDATTMVTIPAPEHAPEFDNFDYSFYHIVDLRTGKEVDPRVGMERFGKAKQIGISDDAAVISGDKTSKNYIHVYVTQPVLDKIVSAATSPKTPKAAPAAPVGTVRDDEGMPVLKDEFHDLIGPLSKKMDWDVYQAALFARALLENVNWHSLARQIDDAIKAEIRRHD